MKSKFFLTAFFISIFLPQVVSAQMIDYPAVKLRTLDKSTARTTTLETKVGETIQYGSLFIKVQSCRKSNPLEKPESAAFIQIWEIPINSDKSEWIFSGWMFASSPALSAMDHAVYDIWVLDCAGKEQEVAPNKVEVEGEDELVEATEESETPQEAVEQNAIDNAEESQPSVEIQPEVTVPAEMSQDTEKTIESVIDDVVEDYVEPGIIYE